MIKIRLNKVLVIFLLFGISSCTDDFERLNNDPLKSQNMNENYLFSYTQIRTSGERYEAWRANLIYSSCIVQQFSSIQGFWEGDKYTEINASYLSAFWDAMYPNAVKGIEDLLYIMRSSSDSAKKINKISQARIMRAFIYHRITDLYGDIPYSEAGKGYISGIINPKYDPQANIYRDMIKEIKESIDAFDDSKTTFGQADLLYGGDIPKWKKFANSLRLRLAMRMSGKDGGAEVQSAITDATSKGGFITKKDEIAWINQTDGPAGVNKNPNSKVFTEAKDNSMRLAKTFVDYLISTEDPRLFVYGAIYDDDEWEVNGSIADNKGGTDFNNYKNALPNGTKSTNNIWKDRKTKPLVQLNRKFMAQYNAPTFLITAAEVHFLLAEASVRSWGGGDAKKHYEDGVTEAMSIFDMYNSEAAIKSDRITQYLTKNPFKISGTNKEKIYQIAKQKWTSNFLNFYESFADLRRLDFLDLKAVYVDGVTKTDRGKFPRRLRYPLNESTRNKENYQLAIKGLAEGDNIKSSIWWDTNKQGL